MPESRIPIFCYFAVREHKTHTHTNTHSRTIPIPDAHTIVLAVVYSNKYRTLSTHCLTLRITFCEPGWTNSDSVNPLLLSNSYFFVLLFSLFQKKERCK